MKKQLLALCSIYLLAAFLLASWAFAQPSIQWQKSLGGTEYDNAHCIQQTTDGGYIVAGITGSDDGDVTGNHGGGDVWVVKLKAAGDIQWQKTLGGASYEYANAIQQTADGGYILAGNSNSINGDVTGHHGSGDYWVVKINVDGDIQWQKSLGGTGLDLAYSVQQTTDGGYIVTGWSNSINGDVTGNHGNGDYWVVKINVDGDIQWQKSLGGSKTDIARSIQQTTDGGYVVVGTSSSYNGNVSGQHGILYEDYWVVKLNANGGILWQKCLGGSYEDTARSIQQTADGGYIVAGYSTSDDGDVSGHHGDTIFVYDAWIVKLSPVSSTPDFSTDPEVLHLSPNPTTALLNIRLSDPYAMDAYTLSDLAGRTLRTAHFGQTVQETTLNTADLPKGMYLLQVRSGGQVFVQKVVVQ